MSEPREPDLVERAIIRAAHTPRCGPWVDGVCQKCGRLDPLDLLEYFEDEDSAENRGTGGHS